MALSKRERRQTDMYALHDVITELIRLWLVRDGHLAGDVFLEGDTWLHMANYLHGVGAMSDSQWGECVLSIKPRLAEAEKTSSEDGTTQ